jgi:hypothetical protein
MTIFSFSSCALTGTPSAGPYRNAISRPCQVHKAAYPPFKLAAKRPFGDQIGLEKSRIVACAGVSRPYIGI